MCDACHRTGCRHKLFYFHNSCDIQTNVMSSSQHFLNFIHLFHLHVASFLQVKSKALKMSSSLSDQNLEKKFQGVTNTQDSIQTLSLWLLHHKAHHQKIVAAWMKVLQKGTYARLIYKFVTHYKIVWMRILFIWKCTTILEAGGSYFIQKLLSWYVIQSSF